MASIIRNLAATVRQHYGITIILLVGLCVIAWFRGDYIIDTLDFAFPYDRMAAFERLFYIWNNTNSLGFLDSRVFANLVPYGIYYLITDLVRLPLFIAQMLFTYITFAGSGLSMYYLTRQLGGSKLAATIAALFYMMNPFSLTFIWPMRSLFILSYAFIPLAVGHYINITQSKLSLKNCILHALLVFGLLTSSFSNPAILMLYLLPVALYTLLLISKRSIGSTVKRFLAVVGIFGLLSSFWLVPFMASMGTEYSNASNKAAANSDDLSVLATNSKSLSDSYSMTGFWALSAGYRGDPYYPWHTSWGTWYNMVLLYVPFLIFVIYMVYAKGSKTKIFLAVPVILSVLFLTGVNGVLAAEKIQLFQAVPALTRTIRSLETKFSPLLLIGLAPAVGLGLAAISRTKATRTFAIVLGLAYVGGPMWPILTGDVIYRGGDVMPSSRVKPPKEYAQAKEWLNDQKENFKILPLPLSTTYQAAFTWPSGFSGTDPTRYLLGKPTLTNSTSGVAYTVPSAAASIKATSQGGQRELLRLAGLANIKYVLLHHDAHWQFITGNKLWVPVAPGLFPALEKDQDVKRFGDLSFIKVPPENLNPLIYSPQNILAYDGDTRESLRAYAGADFYVPNSALIDKQKTTFPKLSPQKTITTLWGHESDLGNHKPNISFDGSTRLYYRDSMQTAYMASRITEAGYELKISRRLPEFNINNHAIKAKTLQEKIVRLANAGPLFYEAQGKLVPLQATQDWAELGAVPILGQELQTRVYTLNNESAIKNGGFEAGPWQTPPGDCSVGERGEPNFGQHIISESAERPNVLRLGSTNHSACVKNKIHRSANDDLYQISFDYKNAGDVPAKYCVWEDQVKQCNSVGKIAYSDEWTNKKQLVIPQTRGSTMQLHLYTDTKDDNETINYYDNVQVSSYRLVTVADVFFEATNEWQAIQDTTLSGNFESISFGQARTNLLGDGSFDSELWQKQVGDCSQSKPGEPQITMGLSQEGWANGKALQLTSKNHTGCTSRQLNTYAPGKDHVVSLYFKNVSGDLPSICLWETGPEECIFYEQIRKNGSKKMADGWYVWTKSFRSANDARDARLFLYTGTTGNMLSENLIDEIIVRELPLNSDNTIIATTDGSPASDKPGAVTFRQINPTKYELELRAKSENPVIVFAESFSSGWAAYIVNQATGKKYQIPDTDHFVANGYANAWLVDAEKTPADFRNTAGKYAIVLEFRSQKFFIWGSILSIVSLSGALGYLLYAATYGQRKQPPAHRFARTR